MGLVEDAVDVLVVDGASLCAYGFDHGSDGEVFDGAKVAEGDFADEVDGLGGEGVVGEPAAVEVVVDEVAGALGTQRFEVGGLGDAASDVLVVAALEHFEQFGLADEHEVAVFGEVFEQ